MASDFPPASNTSNVPAPTTQRSPLTAAEQAHVAALIIHDAVAADRGQVQHLAIFAAQVRGELATLQMSAEALWQGHGVGEADGPYQEAAAAIERAVRLLEMLRGTNVTKGTTTP